MRNKMLSMSAISGLVALGLTSVATAQTINMSGDEKAVAYTPAYTSARSLTASQIRNARSRLPVLDSVNQLPNIGLLQQSESGFSTEAYGSFGGFPFTTRMVPQQPNSNRDAAPVDEAPYRQTGKLFMDFGGALFVCSASVIESGLVLTAAHCVHDFGQGEAGFADEVFFQPARHNDSLPYGTWNAVSIIIPSVYADGTDRCLPDAPGIVCENDVAILVMESQTNFRGAEQEIGDVVGQYGLYENDTGYIPLGGDGDLSAHLTELGYPSTGYTGVRMIQSESIAVQDSAFALGPDTDYNQVVIGSNMTGGSSGGPWMHNFGTSEGYRGTPAEDDDRNRVAAVTSWGFNDDSIKIQGASRFGNNTAFPAGGPSNVQTLINFGCTFGPSKC